VPAVKKILLGAFIVVLLMLGGCAKADKTNDTGQANPSQEELMNQYQVLINENKPAGELTGFIEANKNNLSQENLDKVVIDLIEVQQTRLKDYEDKIFSQEINIIVNNYKYEDLIQLRNIKEDSIKNLLLEAFSNGYKLSVSEGMYYFEIDYDKILKDFGRYASDKVAGYLEIMAAESNKHFASDAALIINLDELASRTVKTEKHIDSYPDFAQIQQVKQFHNYYLKAYLLGLNNTPLFDYQTGKAKESFLKSYENTIANQKGTKLAAILEEYLTLLEGSDYMRSEEIMNYINKVTQG
jgi:outer membrane murein-binding lipoprotein Lpp